LVTDQLIYSIELSFDTRKPDITIPDIGTSRAKYRGMIKIKLGNSNKFVIISNKDYKLVSKYNWSLKRGRTTDYAMTKDPETGKTIYMHVLICLGRKQVEDSRLKVDHRNRCGLDNTRRNLRACSVTQNAGNRGPSRNKSKNGSRFKGVYWNATRHRWIAKITVHYKNKYLGSFVKEAKAAKAYDKMAKKVFGRFAFLNLPN